MSKYFILLFILLVIFFINKKKNIKKIKKWNNHSINKIEYFKIQENVSELNKFKKLIPDIDYNSIFNNLKHDSTIFYYRDNSSNKIICCIFVCPIQNLSELFDSYNITQQDFINNYKKDGYFLYNYLYNPTYQHEKYKIFENIIYDVEKIINQELSNSNTKSNSMFISVFNSRLSKKNKLLDIHTIEKETDKTKLNSIRNQGYKKIYYDNRVIPKDLNMNVCFFMKIFI